LKDKVEVWKNVDGKVDVLAQSAITVSATTQVRMTVKDGYWLCFEFRKGQRWIPLATEIDASPYVPWGMGFRIGLCAKGGDGTFADFCKIELIH
jgi:xylan 1,4-beta-xylosidase